MVNDDSSKPARRRTKANAAAPLPPVLHPVGGLRDSHRLPRSTVYAWAARGALRIVKIGSKSFVTDESLQHFMANLPPANIRPAGQPAGPVAA